ncbi:MAG TPA: adenylate/guanylate cyclase domain-containing protein, partial [Euzebyales bacterium]|nr:adenylate/guanylate cyclase domain-containing protein [Euzebyales bacterium]
SGVSAERASALWRALGFATQDDDAAVFTDGDIRALRLTDQLIQNGILDPSLAASTARMIGQHMSRLAESQVHMLRDVLVANPELGADERQLARLVEHLTPELETLQNYVWRRHLAAYAGRLLAAPDEEVDERRQVVGFADMVGFTSLTRRATEKELVDVVEGFDALAADVVAENHGRIVKMLGDEVLFVADSPVHGAEIALTLLARAEQDPSVPALRAGLAYGRVLNRFGDVYGSVVNIASRLTSVARPGTVLVDLEMSEALQEEPGYVVRPRRPVSVRGYTRLRSAALRRAGDERPASLADFTAELLGLTGDDEPHVPLEPDDEHTTPRRRRRR